MSVCVVSLDSLCCGRSRYLYIVLGGFLHILGAPNVQSYLLPNFYLPVADIVNPDLFACSSRTWIILDIARFYEDHCQPSSGSAWPACQKTVIGRGGHNLHRVCQTAVTAPPRVGCVVWCQSTVVLSAIV